MCLPSSFVAHVVVTVSSDATLSSVKNAKVKANQIEKTVLVYLFHPSSRTFNCCPIRPPAPPPTVSLHLVCCGRNLIKLAGLPVAQLYSSKAVYKERSLPKRVPCCRRFAVKCNQLGPFNGPSQLVTTSMQEEKEP